MPDFTRYTNYTPKTAFSGVVFGAKSPVLEVEMNEIQQIFNTKLKRLSKFLGNVVIAEPDGGVTFDPVTLEMTITKCTALAGAMTAFIPTASVTLTEEEPVAYLRLEERVVTGKDTLHEYGLLSSETEVENPAIDPRIGVETSRRKVVEVTFMCGEELPKTTDPDSCQYIHLGSMQRVETPGVPSDDPDAPPPEPVVTYTLDKPKANGSVNEMLDEFSASVDELVTQRINEALSSFIPPETPDEEPTQYITTRYENGVLYLGVNDPSGETKLPYYEDNTIFLQFAENAEMGGGTPVDLPIASRTTAGIVKIGDGIDVTPDGTISSDVTTVSEAVAETAAAKVVEQLDDVDESEIDDMFKDTTTNP